MTDMIEADVSQCLELRDLCDVLAIVALHDTNTADWHHEAPKVTEQDFLARVQDNHLHNYILYNVYVQVISSSFSISCCATIHQVEIESFILCILKQFGVSE